MLINIDKGGKTKFFVIRKFANKAKFKGISGKCLCTITFPLIIQRLAKFPYKDGVKLLSRKEEHVKPELLQYQNI